MKCRTRDITPAIFESLLDPLGQFLGNCPLALLELVLGLGAQDVASPVDTGAVVVLGLEGVNQLGKLTLILLENEQQRIISIAWTPSAVAQIHKT